MADTLGGHQTPESSRPRASRVWTWVAAVVLLAVLASMTWLVLQPDTEGVASAPATVTSAPGPTPSPTPSAPEPTPAAFALAGLPEPRIDRLLPHELPQSDVDRLRALPGSVARPKADRTPVWAQPDATKKPVLALESAYYDAAARWLVLERRPGWVKVLVPYGRGALPSQDPERVNGTAGWLREDDVVLRAEKRAVLVDLSDRTITLRKADGTRETFPAAVGAPETPTPLGLTQVFTVTEAVNTGLSVFLSMQSESLDGFYGTEYAATAIHVGVGQGQAVSNGCVRLAPGDFERFAGLDPGVPVLVTA
ncbi:L,D-transpeptidase [Promicromonospora sp. NPDC050880]|uniref:L,D-transpeptidase n=1 Tax=Promicromonospora sp. NPDC050880 TaxID=3364406 RepID=UPI0037996A28